MDDSQVRIFTLHAVRALFFLAGFLHGIAACTRGGFLLQVAAGGCACGKLTRRSCQAAVQAEASYLAGYGRLAHRKRGKNAI